MGNVFPFIFITKTVATAKKTSPTGHLTTIANTTKTTPSPNGIFFIMSMDYYITRLIGKNTPPT